MVGYAGLKKSDWNIIVSTPSEVVTSMLLNTVKKISGLVLAILFFITTGVAFLSSRIAKPLEQLARLVQANDSLMSPEKLSSIRAWYQEAYLLRDAMEKRFRLVSAQFAALSDEAMTDPLTGLYNRRGFYEQLTYIKNLKNQCAIAVDIDHFKTINDRFGHSAGAYRAGSYRGFAQTDMSKRGCYQPLWGRGVRYPFGGNHARRVCCDSRTDPPGHIGYRVL